MRSWRLDRRDPRFSQIAVLGSLLIYGMGWLGFDQPAAHLAAILVTALTAQYACGRLAGLPGYDPRSALISGLSLCLLLRTGSALLAAACAFASIVSKFVFRIRGKHVFNPTNFGLTAMMLATGEVWVSPGQWGSSAFFGFLLACAGGLVVHRAWRSDVTFAFLASYLTLLFGRAVWLGDPLAIPLHQLQSGGLVLFGFFMISDPKTTPDSRAGRILFGLLVAAGAYYVQFRLFRPNGLLWSLAALSLLVPVLDRLLPGRRYEWPTRPPVPRPVKGVRDEATLDLGRALPRRPSVG
jgi:Na+-transporting NADH:ubiquinone oxidoreductase subunit NqrB